MRKRIQECLNFPRPKYRLGKPKDKNKLLDEHKQLNPFELKRKLEKKLHITF